MDPKRKRELIEGYLNRKPEMGVISFKCKETGESFLGISKDTRADYNSNCVKLNTNTHPNKAFLALWKKFGQEGFEYNVLKVLKYEDPKEDHTDELEKMRNGFLAQDPNARKIWR